MLRAVQQRRKNRQFGAILGLILSSFVFLAQDEVANTDSKLLIYRLFQEGRVLAQDGILDADIRGFFDAIDHGWLMKVVEHRTLHPYPEQRLRVMT